MGKLKGLKTLQKTLIDGLNDLVDVKVRDAINQIKAEHRQNETNVRIKLLSDICKGENLDFNVLSKKYLKNKELDEISDEISKEEFTDEKEVLSKEIINGITYYYDNKDMGNVYNTSNKIIGRYKNNKVVFN